MKRIYRERFKLNGFESWETTYKSTNLFVKACKDLRFETFELVKKLWSDLLTYIEKNRGFLTSLGPIRQDKKAPKIAKKMIESSRKADVGPMAAVAGAIAKEVGQLLLKECNECVVENGGDVFLKLNTEPVVGLYTQNHYFKDSLSVKIKISKVPIGVCSSSAKIGPSLSLGKADLSLIIDRDTAFADALATKTANLIKNEYDIENAIEFAKSKNVDGCLFIKGKKIGIWGKIELV